MRLAVYWTRVGLGFLWFHTGLRIYEVVQTARTKRSLRAVSNSQMGGMTTHLNQLQVWGEEYQSAASRGRVFANAELRANVLVYAPHCRRSKQLGSQLIANNNSATFRVVRGASFGAIAHLVIHKLRASNRIGAGPIRRMHVAKAVLRSPTVLISLLNVYIIKVSWNDGNLGIEKQYPSTLPSISVEPYSDVFVRLLAAEFASTAEVVALGAFTGVYVREQMRGDGLVWVKVSRTRFHQLLILQLQSRCEQLLEDLRPVVRNSPYSAMVEYLLGVHSPSKGSLWNLQQSVPSSGRHVFSNLVSHSQFKSRDVVSLRDVEILHQRFIVADSQLVLTENGADCRADSVAGLWPYVFGSPTHDGRVLVSGSSQSGAIVESAIAGFGRVDSNWFHFLTETLPRLIAASDAADSDSCVLVQRELLPAGREAIQQLTRRALVELSEGRTQVGLLHVGIGTSSTMDTPFRGDLIGDFDSDALKATRDRLLGLYPTPRNRGRRVFMLRKSNYRRVLNLRQIRRILVRHGFEPVDMSLLSLQRQIETMQECEVVVTQGGAAMTNLMFAHPGTKLVGLVGPTGTQDRYWSRYLGVFGIQSTFLIGDSRKGKRSPAIHDDFSIDLSEFEECISRHI